MTIEPIESPEYEDDEAEEFHDESLVEPHPLPSRLPMNFHGSVKTFYKNLADRLMSYGIDLNRLPRKTSPTNPPACFKLNQTSYTQWLEAASIELVNPPPRLDMPGEPNYCHDCTQVFKSRAIKAGACQFPNTRFETDKKSKERELVGVSRSKDSVPGEDEISYHEMVVPLSALQVELRNHIRAAGIKKVGVREWLRMPVAVRQGLISRKI